MHRLIISPEEFKDLLMRHSCLIIDVRTAAEFFSDHLPGAVHIPLQTLGVSSLPYIPGEDTRVITVCAHGYRSADAAHKMIEMGFSNVYTLQGGMEAWHALEEKKQPITQCSISKAGFDRPRSIIYGTIHAIAGLLALFVDVDWSWCNVFLGTGMIVNGMMGWCGLSLFFRR